MSLDTHLTHLETSGLVRLAQVEPELEYLFKHALVQDAAYESLLKVDRRQLHRAIGETLEKIYADRLNELAPRLGEHFAEAGDDERALHYFTLAGETAANVYANIEAASHYAQALALIKRTPPTEAGNLRQLFLQRGRVLELSGQYEEALANYIDLETFARDRGDPSLELVALMEHTKLRAVPSAMYDPQQGRVLAERTLALAQQLGEQEAEARALWILLILNIYSGNDLQQAIPFGERAESLARQFGLRELLAFILNDIWYPYVGTGQLDRAWAALAEAGQIWRELGNLPMLAANVSYTSTMHLFSGAFQESIALGEEAFQLAGSINNREGQATSRFLIILAYTEIGHFDQALAVTEAGLVMAEEFDLLAALSGTRAELGWVYGQLGQVEHGVSLARLACQVADEKIPSLSGWTRAISARLQLLKGEIAEAEATLSRVSSYRDVQRTFGFIPPFWIGIGLANGELALAQNDFERALTLADELYADLSSFGVALMRPDTLYLKGRVLVAQNKLAEATQVLTQALAEASRSRRIAWQILALLSQIEDQRGNPTDAQRWRNQAQPLVAYLRDHCPAQLQPAFLNLPAVKAILTK